MGAPDRGTGVSVRGTKGISSGEAGPDSVTSDIPGRCCCCCCWEGRLVKAGGGRGTRDVDVGGWEGGEGICGGGRTSRGEAMGTEGVGW